MFKLCLKLSARQARGVHSENSRWTDVCDQSLRNMCFKSFLEYVKVFYLIRCSVHSADSSYYTDFVCIFSLLMGTASLQHSFDPLDGVSNKMHSGPRSYTNNMALPIFYVSTILTQLSALFFSVNSSYISSI